MNDDRVDISAPCEHASSVKIHKVKRPADGCVDCLAIGGEWVHLRQCLTCGHVGCCDSSPNKHASKHYRATKHPIASSAEVGETWAWCFIDERVLQ